MRSNIMEFLAAFKDLEQLFNEQYQTTSGVTEYINRLASNQSLLKDPYYNEVHKKLKKLRYLRNRLVHESDSFETEKVSREDIQWLKDFKETVAKGNTYISSKQGNPKSASKKHIPLRQKIIVGLTMVLEVAVFAAVIFLLIKIIT